jgi:hypothetical protein
MTEKNINKEERKEEGDFLSSISALEKNISLIRSKLEEEFSKKESKHNKTLQKTKEAVDEIISGYKKKLLEKDSEIEEIKSSVKNLVLGYEELLKTKDEYLSNTPKENKPEEISLSKLKSLGVPEEMFSLSKEEILRKAAGIIKENLVLSKKTDSMREKLLEKEEEIETSKKAYEKNFKNMTLEYSKLLEKNKKLDEELNEFKKKTAFLSGEKAKENEASEKNISKLRSYYEEKVNEVEDKKTRREIELEVSLNLLQKQLKECQEKLSEKDSKEEEFLKEVEETVKSTLNRKASEIFKN